jgi:Copper type II ascorbate-dependent monooxygenase, C-terminal domain
MKHAKLILGSVALSSFLLLQSCEKTFQDYNVADIPTDFTALEKPAAGTGYQIHIDAFPIQANYEREFYVRKMLGNTEEVYLKGFEMKARPGTHHMIAYSFGKDDVLPEPNVMYDQNMPNNKLSFRSGQSSGGALFQSPQANYKFNLPTGYALKMEPNISFLMNSHYFNKTDKTRFGELFVNFYTTAKTNVKQLLDVEYLEPTTINLPANKKTTMVTDYIMEKETAIPMMMSHYHKRGEKFEIRIKGGPRNGELIYESTYYDDPLVKVFTPELVLKKGEGLTSTVTYNNTSNRTIKFGVTSEDEMNIIILFKHEK